MRLFTTQRVDDGWMMIVNIEALPAPSPSVLISRWSHPKEMYHREQLYSPLEQSDEGQGVRSSKEVPNFIDQTPYLHMHAEFQLPGSEIFESAQQCAAKIDQLQCLVSKNSQFGQIPGLSKVLDYRSTHLSHVRPFPYSKQNQSKNDAASPVYNITEKTIKEEFQKFQKPCTTGPSTPLLDELSTATEDAEVASILINMTRQITSETDGDTVNNVLAIQRSEEPIYLPSFITLGSNSGLIGTEWHQVFRLLCSNDSRWTQIQQHQTQYIGLSFLSRKIDYEKRHVLLTFRPFRASNLLFPQKEPELSMNTWVWPPVPCGVTSNPETVQSLPNSAPNIECTCLNCFQISIRRQNQLNLFNQPLDKRRSKSSYKKL